MQYINILFSIINEMAPYLLLGFFCAGILHVLVPHSIFSQYLAKNNFLSVFFAALFGVPLPLFSCGVIPTAMALRKEGASKGAVISFLIATPQTGVDSIIATYSLLGLPFAIIRPIAAFITAIFGGSITNLFVKKESLNNTSYVVSCDNSIKPVVNNKIKAIFKYGFVDIIQDIGKWLILGILIAGLITYFVPTSFFHTFAGNPILSIVFVLILSIPMYICATGSIPIAIALMLKGISPGAALVLLMAGPATNIASILIIGKVLGRKSLVLYLTSIIFGAVSFALIIDYLLPADWFTLSVMHNMSSPHNSFFWLKVSSSIVLLILIVNSFILQYFPVHVGSYASGITAYKIDGMHCNHCKVNITKILKEIKGVKSIEVNLKDGIVYIEGVVEEIKIKEAVSSLGFEFKGKVKK